MTEVMQTLQQIEQGEVVAAEKLLPLVYVELRRLARRCGRW
ncbi:MAG TPA: ECF-type sigma factor [Gemmataceae bacterium]|nr:ECF-type sigma factor [Gemmataceae bacterium]